MRDGASRADARLVLLRHGATAAAPGVHLGSRADPPLSDRGAAQASRAGEQLAGRRFRDVAVSPLLRARQTAELAVPNAVLHVDARLAEIDLGAFTLLTWEGMKAFDRSAAHAWRAGAAAPGGEAAAVLWRRVVAAALDMADRLNPGEDGLIVAHSGPIRAVVGSARGLSPADVRKIRTPHGGLRVVRLTPVVLARWRALLEAPRD